MNKSYNKSIFSVYLKITIILILGLTIFSPKITYATTIKKVKTGDFIIPSNQTRDEVEKYATFKLLRQASEEAGVAIYSSSNFVNGKISKEEIKTQTANVSKTKVLKSYTYNKGNDTYLHLEVQAEIDSEDLEHYLKTMMNNNEIRKENENLKKQLDDLAKQYEESNTVNYKELNIELQKLSKEQKLRSDKIRAEAKNARIKYQELENKHKSERAIEEQKLLEMKQIAKQEELEAERKIAAEKDKALKAELKYEKELSDLRRKAAINEQEFDLNITNDIEIILLESLEARKIFKAQQNNYKELNNNSFKDLKRIYQEQEKIIKKSEFNKPVPVQDEWEPTAEFRKRVKDYESEKKNFKHIKEEKLLNLKNDYDEKIKARDIEIKKETLLSLKPTYERLKKYNNDYFDSIHEPHLSFDILGKDVDNMEMPFRVVHNSDKYDFKYKFTNIKDFRAMYESRDLFRITAFYSVEPKGSNIHKVLRGFKLIHLGKNVNKNFIIIGRNVEVFPEIKEYNEIAGIIDKEITLDKEDKENKENKLKNNNNTSNTVSDSKTYKRSTTKPYKDKVTYPGYLQLGFDGIYGFDSPSSYIFDFTIKYNWVLLPDIAVYVNGGVNMAFMSSITKVTDSFGYETETKTKEYGYGVFAGVGAKYRLSDFIIYGEANINPMFGTKLLSVANGYFKVGIGYGFFSKEKQYFGIDVYFGALVGSKTIPGVGFSLKF